MIRPMFSCIFLLFSYVVLPLGTTSTTGMRLGVLGSAGMNLWAKVLA